MDRRESLKTLVMGTFASGIMLNGCISDKEKPYIGLQEKQLGLRDQILY